MSSQNSGFCPLDIFNHLYVVKNTQITQSSRARNLFNSNHTILNKENTGKARAQHYSILRQAGNIFSLVVVEAGLVPSCLAGSHFENIIQNYLKIVTSLVFYLLLKAVWKDPWASHWIVEPQVQPDMTCSILDS